MIIGSWAMVNAVVISTVGMAMSKALLRVPMTVIVTALTSPMVVAWPMGVRMVPMPVPTVRFSNRCQQGAARK